MYEKYESDLAVVKKELESQGIKNYTVYPANNCVGVTYGRVSSYYIVKNGVVVDIQID